MEKGYFHSVILNPDRCIGCTYCLKICPTEAIRLRNGKASILAERCIDCGECIRVCPNHAKNAITDNLDVLKNFKYKIALVLPVLYAQYNSAFSPNKITSALKSLGFDEVVDTTSGSEIVDILGKSIIKNYKEKPVINSSCPAIVRLIQVRFPELLNNILDIETPVEITARISKQKAVEETGYSIDDIGVILITPCTARVTSVKNPLGTTFSCIDRTISIKDIYGPILRIITSNEIQENTSTEPTSNSLLWYSPGGNITALQGENTLAVDGINNAISILEEIELGKLNNFSFIEITACPGGCLGGPLVVENRYIAYSNICNSIKHLDYKLNSLNDSKEFMEMYNSGFIRLTEKIASRAIMSLDQDIVKSIEKMDNIQTIINTLPGINCGICGAPTCRAFAEDIVTGTSSDNECPVANIKKRTKNENS